ncbi:hypothetical protein LK994_13870 [Ferruginibacter lapsinanis]|uniref:hypothetical protein n=1 Tax=Ferruginibacter lapsinanis TaxID=563172 RepID=UPI001E655196|nr:hypothetical protein [Ferruginibacter lapsinanis]UEG49725.1 hypothetical protein LK994_13870 [Ferruginibacter lapsinanis]
MKLRLTYLFLLCMLLTGYGYAIPPAQQHHSKHSPAQHNNILCFGSHLHTAVELTYAENNDENDEDESGSIRKKTISFTSMYNKAIVLSYLSNALNNKQWSNKQYIYTPSDRYLFLRVIRI